MHLLIFLLLLSTLLVLPISVSAQITAQPAVEDTAAEQEVEPVFDIVEVMPSFPGGEEAMFKFLASETKYPQQAMDGGVQGTVYVDFIVEMDGRIGSATVLRGIGSGCDEEALRVVNAMPAWKPGEHAGKKVRVRYNLPLRFILK